MNKKSLILSALLFGTLLTPQETKPSECNFLLYAFFSSCVLITPPIIYFKNMLLPYVPERAADLVKNQEDITQYEIDILVKNKKPESHKRKIITAKNITNALFQVDSFLPSVDLESKHKITLRTKVHLTKGEKIRLASIEENPSIDPLLKKKAILKKLDYLLRVPENNAKPRKPTSLGMLTVKIYTLGLVLPYLILLGLS